MGEYQEKLREKQDIVQQVQLDKDQIKAEIEALRSEKDTEAFTLREQNQRLQVQLNHGRSGFAEFKEKKAKEVADLLAQIESLTVKVRRACGSSPGCRCVSNQLTKLSFLARADSFQPQTV